MTLVLIIACIMPMSVCAVTYPQGVTAQQAEDAIENTDKLISGFLRELSNTTLEDMLMPEICSDNLLSFLVVEIYKALEENADTLTTLGIRAGCSDVAKYLVNSPEVAAKLNSASSWQSVDLTGVSWGISGRDSFVAAASTAFGPLNSILYTLLCGGNYDLVLVLGVKGEMGYENSIIPIYQTLGMTEYTSPQVFYNDAAANKYSMIAHVLVDILTFVEKILEAPARMLTERLPAIAYFVNNGGLESAISKLMEPLKISVLGVPLLSIDTFVDLSALKGNINLDINFAGNSLSGIKMAPINLEVFASCGTVTDGTVVANKGDVYIEFLRWAIESLKLSKDFIINIATENVQADTVDLNTVITNLLAKPTDEIISILVALLSAQKGEPNNYQWSFSNQEDATVIYTPNLAHDDYIKVVEEMDGLLNDIIAEGGEFNSLREMLQPMLYSNELLSEVVLKLYSLLEGEELKSVIALLGVELSPEAIAKSLREEQFSSVASQLKNFSSWSYVRKENLNWGFTDGDREGFVNAVSAVLRPADELLRLLLASDKITFLDAVDFYGSDGYNTAIIPVLEALGVYGEDILSYEEYIKAIETEDAIKPVVTSICTLIERVLDKPVYTITEILPNFMYFLNNGGLKICIENLFYPAMTILEKLGISDMIDLSALSNIDANALINDLFVSLKLQFALPELNLSQFEGMGQLITAPSKRTQSGAMIQIYAVKADQPEVAATLIRYLIEIVKLPGNEGVIDSLLESLLTEMGDNQMVASFAQGIGEDVKAMTVDEAVEWLYKLFFRERVVVEVTEPDNYEPDVPEYKGGNDKVIKAVLTVVGVIFVIAAMAAIINRDKIKYYIEDRKNKSEED